MKFAAVASLWAACGAQTAFTATRLRVEYLPDAITIDVATPKFSYALSHPQRNQAQTSYHIVVQDAKGNTQWDSGVVQSNKTLNIVYAGAALVSDADYTWSVTWTDSAGASSAPAQATFSTAMLNPPSDFSTAAWVSSTRTTAGDGGLNTYRSTFTVPTSSSVSRARLYIAGVGYWKAWINGQAVDSHELGTFTTFERRVLYDVVDVSGMVQPGCNGLGIMLGHGWFSQPTVHSGPRQVMMILSVSTSDGTTTYYSSSVTGKVEASAQLPGGRAGATSALTFVVTAGPVQADDIYIGETFDGRVDYALRGWASCAYKPAAGVTWAPATAPSTSVAQLGSILSVHPVQIVTDKDYTVVPGGPNQPGPGVFVYDFGQNMAGTVTLNVPDCPVGTVITMLHGEILYPNGSVHNHYLPGAPMTGVYICNGQDAMEVYRYMFTYMGFRYVQITGYPGVPGEEALTAHFIHSDMPQTGEFSSSNALMNAIQHATRYASLSNLMDIPTDCPQRERRGWLGDAQLSFETVIHNLDGGAFYTKWIKDFVDTQIYDNLTMNAKGAMPDCIPFYGHGHTESDPGWGIAAWNIPTWFAEYYDDDSFEAAYYPYLKWYMEHWITLAQNNTGQPGIFPIAWWGDWAEYYPGPYQHRTLDYADFFYVLGLQKTLQWATRLNVQADVQRYTTLLQAAQAQYLQIYYNATTHCYVDCMYASQIFGLTLGLQEPGSADEAAVWANAMSWFDANGTNAKYPDHFGGGIIALKLVYNLLQKFGQQGLGLTWQLQDTIPSFGYWITEVGATTLIEAYDLTATSGGASYNHIMFGGSGNWYYSTLAGLARTPGSRSWQNLQIQPPGPATGILSNLSWAGASIDTPMGLVASSWSAPIDSGYAACGIVGESVVLNLTCTGGTFDSIKFASFGTPSGSCSTGFSYGTCNANDTISIVSQACLGKSTCTISSADGTFGDPCYDVVKQLAVALGSSTCTAIIPVYTLDTTVPVNAVATVTIPTVGPAGSMLIREGPAGGAQTVVWSKGSFVPGTAGVNSGAVGADGQSVVFAVGSGSYSFIVSST